MPGAYEDDFDEDELKKLEEVDDAANVDQPAPEETDKAVAEPADPGTAAPKAESEPVADDEYAAWLQKHGGKTPEELSRLAYDQTRRANQSGFAARTATQQIEEIRSKAKELAESRRAKLVSEREAFNTKLIEDPDAATRDLAERFFSAEEQQIATDAEDTERQVRVDDAISFASQYIPDLPQAAVEMHSFGTEMGFSSEELNAIDDGRQLVTLRLANIAGNLMKAGVIDIRGNLKAAPPPVSEQPSDPRLRGPAPMSTAGSGGGAPRVNTPTAQKIKDVLLLSDKDFDALSDEDLLRISA